MNGDQLVVQWDPIAVGVWITFRQPLSADVSSGSRTRNIIWLSQ